MSTVFLHVGQCGIQLGRSFWEEVEYWGKDSAHFGSAKKTSSTNTKQNSSRSSANQTRSEQATTSLLPRLAQSHASESLPYSLPDGSIPSIFVDSESKVVQTCLTGSNSSSILACRVPRDCVLTDRTGRGNNWAYGYYGRKGMASRDPFQLQSLRESVRECLRKVVERCDRFMGIVLFHSLAGGTGSGLGSALLEQFKDDYLLACSMSVSVAPFSAGETPLQHYNSLLCLSRLHECCDGVLVFQNDRMLDAIQRYMLNRRLTGDARQTMDVSVSDMNRHISLSLCNSFLPLWNPRQSKGCFEVWELLRSLCADPSTKFITPVLSHSQKRTTTWQELISFLTHSSTLQRKPSSQEKPRTSSMVFIARGSPCNVDSLIRDSSSMEYKLKQAYNTVSWNPFPIDLWFSHERSLGEKRFSTVLANTSLISEYIEGVYKQADIMFQEKAYLHWYEKFGCEEQMFTEAFESVQKIVHNYSML